MPANQPEIPENIKEFNQIAGLIFAQLYTTFPVAIDIDLQAIANAIGVEGDLNRTLPSGRTAAQQIANTVVWLNDSGYTYARGGSPSQRVTLAEKGLAALNAVPAGLSATIGSSLVQAASGTGQKDLSPIGSLIGGMLGGFISTAS